MNKKIPCFIMGVLMAALPLYAQVERSKSIFPNNFISELSLTEQQIQQMEKLHLEHMDYREKSGLLLLKARQEYQNALYNPDNNMEQIRAYESALNKISEERNMKKTEYVLTIKSILTPNQFKKWVGYKFNQK